MDKKSTGSKSKRSYPKPWNILIPSAVVLISGIILFLVVITIRVALGLPAFW